MAKNEQEKREDFVAVDIGSYSIKFAYIQQQEDESYLLKTLAQIIIPNYETKISQDQRELMSKDDVKKYCLKEMRQLLTTKLTELLYDNEIQTKSAVTFASNREINIRCIEIPAQKDKNQYPELIKAEANKQMPFSMNNAVLGYSMLGEKTKDNEQWREVMVAALQKEIVEYINLNLKGGSLTCEGILTLPQILELSLENQMKPYSTEGKKVAIIHCGNSGTAVMIYKNNRLQFFREINMGGAAITDAIYAGGEIDGENYKPSTYEEAIELKHKLGIVPPDEIENLKGLEKFAAQTIFDNSDKLFQNIQLSISYYISQSNEPNVDKIILSGGSAEMINFKTFIEESMEISVELAKPFENITIGEIKYSPSQRNNDATSLAPVIGVAKYDNKVSNIINFIDILNPERNSKKTTSTAKLPSLSSLSSKFGDNISGFNIGKFIPELNETNLRIIAVIIVILILSLSFLPVMSIKKQFNNAIKEQKKLQQQKDQIIKENGNVSELLETQKNIEKYTSFADNLMNLKIYNSKVLAEIASFTPQQIFLTELSIELQGQEGKFTISGDSDNSESVFDYLSILGESKILINPILSSTKETPIDDNKYYINFVINGLIDKEAIKDKLPESEKNEAESDENDDSDEEELE